MQLQTILITLLSAGALALPTSTPSSSNTADFTGSSNATESTIEKRAHYGWIGSYGKKDYTCKHDHHGARPKMTGSCIKLTPASDNLGISWGDWPLGFAQLNTYTDENCETPSGTIIQRPLWDSKEGPGTCASVRLTGPTWKSVMSN